jgi:hypothetical protein
VPARSTPVIVEGSADDDIERIARLALVAVGLVDAGRVVPGLTVEPDGRARSWWWPLPAASDRPALRALLVGETVAHHVQMAEQLAAMVDGEVRARLHHADVTILAKRPGRRTVPEAWLQSLSSSDPWLSPTLDDERVLTLATAVAEWARSGRPTTGRTRLCLRLREPEADGDDDLTASATVAPWRVEVLAQDLDEPSLVVPAVDVWQGRSALGPLALEELLAGLGQVARIAPEMAGLLDQAEPSHIEMGADEVLAFVGERSVTLADAGIGLLLPAWWVHRGRVGLRVKASTRRTSGTGAVTAGGVGLDQLVAFTWEAALGGEKLTQRDLQQLDRAARAKRSLVRFRGQWIEIAADELAAVLERAGTKDRARAGDLLRTALGLDQLDAPPDVEITGVAATGWLGRLVDDALHTTVEPVPTPATFIGELRPYQERGVAWLAFLGRLGLGACLADDMGLGKTAQVIATLLAEPLGPPTLVVCPVSVLGNWQRELARFAPSLSVLAHHGPDRFDHDEPFATRAVGHDVVLTTYSLVARDIEPLTTVDWSRLVLDEAQQVKNPSTAQTRAVRQLTAGRRIALTGTPVENRLSELWSIMHVLNPGLLGTAQSFRARFAVPIEVDHDEDATIMLRRMTAPFVLRRLKSDRSIITDLPDKIEVTDHCSLTREQASLYQAVVDDLLAAADDAEGISRRGIVLAGLTKLKQVCNHPAHLLGDGSPLAARSGKLGRTEELIEQLLEVGDKALCFTQFRQWGDLLQPYLAHRFGVEVLWLHGNVTRKRRDAMVEQFQTSDGPPLLLVSLKAGGTGLNLTAASHVIHLDRWWNPAVEDQATDRAYRIGQTSNVLVHKLVTTGTVEERIDDLIASKRALAEAVVGGGEDWLTELSTDDLRNIVSLRDAEVEG